MFPHHEIGLSIVAKQLGRSVFVQILSALCLTGSSKNHNPYLKTRETTALMPAAKLAWQRQRSHKTVFCAENQRPVAHFFITLAAPFTTKKCGKKRVEDTRLDTVLTTMVLHRLLLGCIRTVSKS